MDIQKKFHSDGINTTIVNMDLDALQDELAPGIYSIVPPTMMSPWMLAFKAKSFELPPKIFGDTVSKVQRLMSRYEDRGEISALLSGHKGTGKTMLAHLFSNQAIEKGKAVILVDSAHDNIQGLKDFLGRIGNAVFIFDEFAKNFDKDEQAQMLDFFDGSNYSKRATFIIENAWQTVNAFMLDRPGRIRFHFQYSKLSQEVIKEVCEYLGMTPLMTNCISSYGARVREFGMDTLNRIIEEIQFDSIDTLEDFNSLINILNIPGSSEPEYIVKTIKVEETTYTNVPIHVHRAGPNSVEFDFRTVPMDHPIIKHFMQIKDSSSLLGGIIRDRLKDHNEVSLNDPNNYWWDELIFSSTRLKYTVNDVSVFQDKLFPDVEVSVELLEDDTLNGMINSWAF